MKSVTVYSTATCPYCRMLKDYLKERKVEFTDIMLDQQPENVQAYLDTCGNRGVPCTHVTSGDGQDTKILGFDKERLDQALGL
jgi:glutaredoxin 3